MKKPFKITPDDFHLLMEELASLSELLKDERLRRREEIDNLKIDVLALRKTLTHLHPESDQLFKRVQDEMIHRTDPEATATPILHRIKAEQPVKKRA